MCIYRIREWQRIFENNRSKELKHPTWVAIPNRHDGTGYRTVAALPDGAAVYGVWMILVQIASRCVPHGTLIRDGGDSHTPESLAIRSGFSADLIRRCLEVVCQPEIGWMEKIPQEGAGIPQEGAGIPQEGAGFFETQQNQLFTDNIKENLPIPHLPAARARAERNGKNRTLLPVMEAESNPEPCRQEKDFLEREARAQNADDQAEPAPPEPRSRFPDFWAVYSVLRGVAETNAEGQWRRLGCDADIVHIGQCLKSYARSRDVQTGAIMNADKWLVENYRNHWRSRWPAGPGPKSEQKQREFETRLRERLQERYDEQRQSLR